MTIRGALTGSLLAVGFLLSCHMKDDGVNPDPDVLTPPLGVVFSTAQKGVTFFSLSTGEIVRSDEIDGWVTAADVNLAGSWLYTGDAYANEVNSYRLPHFALNTSVRIGGSPRDLYTNTASNLVYIITRNALFWRHLVSEQNYDSLEVGLEPRRMAIRPPDEAQAWVACEGDRSVHILDLFQSRELDTLTFSTRPTDVVFSPGGDRAYVALRNPGQVIVLNAMDFVVTDTLDAGTGPFDLDVSYSGQFLAASDSLTGHVRVWDLNHQTHEDIYVGGSPARVRFRSACNTFYVMSLAENRIIRVDVTESGPMVMDSISIEEQILELTLWEPLQ